MPRCWSNQIDLNQLSGRTDRSLFNNPTQIQWRARDTSPNADARRRQQPVLGLPGAPGGGAALDRPAIVKQLFNGLADIGNGSPFAPVYGSRRSVR